MALAKTLVLAMGAGMLAFLIADEYMLFVPAIWILLTVASSVWAKNKCKYGRHAGYVLNGRLVCTSCGHESQ